MSDLKTISASDTLFLEQTALDLLELEGLALEEEEAGYLAREAPEPAPEEWVVMLRRALSFRGIQRRTPGAAFTRVDRQVGVNLVDLLIQWIQRKTWGMSDRARKRMQRWICLAMLLFGTLVLLIFLYLLIPAFGRVVDHAFWALYQSLL